MEELAKDFELQTRSIKTTEELNIFFRITCGSRQFIFINAKENGIYVCGIYLLKRLKLLKNICLGHECFTSVILARKGVVAAQTSSRIYFICLKRLNIISYFNLGAYEPQNMLLIDQNVILSGMGVGNLCLIQTMNLETLFELLCLAMRVNIIVKCLDKVTIAIGMSDGFAVYKYNSGEQTLEYITNYSDQFMNIIGVCEIYPTVFILGSSFSRPGYCSFLYYKDLREGYGVSSIEALEQLEGDCFMISHIQNIHFDEFPYIFLKLNNQILVYDYQTEEYRTFKSKIQNKSDYPNLMDVQYSRRSKMLHICFLVFEEENNSETLYHYKKKLVGPKAQLF